MPHSLNCDFELAVINAFRKVFRRAEVKIYGCFFHFSQALFRRVQTRGHVKRWWNEDFRLAFKRLQALAFVPTSSVVPAFNIIREEAPASFVQLLTYFENTYICALKPNSRSSRVKPRFDIEFWNVYDRVRKNLPRTKNAVENWHMRIQSDERKHLNIFRGIYTLEIILRIISYFYSF